MIGDSLFGVVTQQPKECQLNRIAVVRKLKMTVKKKNSSVIPLTWKNKHMHTYVHKTHILPLPLLLLSLHHQ